jgi:hypothetical protein
MRDAVLGPEHLATVDHARATIEEATGVEMFASRLKEGAPTAASAWMNRQLRNVG